MVNKLSSIVVLVGLLISCGEQKLTTIDLITKNPAQINLKLNKGERIQFYSDLQLVYEIKPDIVYAFEFYQANKLLFSGGVDPFNVTTETNNNSPNIIKGKLEGEFTAQYDDNYSVVVTLIKNNTPSLNIHHAKVTVVKD
ncbi:MAG: hypothetical protein CMD31_08170 [Flavobacteriales bacterium]|nr:hypothetical protein [Flavobacteriales bacterium]